MSLVFFYPQFKKLTGAERLILKLADYTSRRPGAKVILLTHRFADECMPALGKKVTLQQTGWRVNFTGNHYLDAAIEYALGPLLALRLPRPNLSGIIYFGPPSVPAMWFTRRALFAWGSRRRVPMLYFCFEPPRFIYSDTEDIVQRLGRAGRLLSPLFSLYRQVDRRMVRAAHHALSNSPYGSRRIWDAYRRRATVIEHGVDFAPPEVSHVEELRTRYGLIGRAVVVTVNHLHPRKRIDLFLRASHYARGSVPLATALVVGGGPELDALRAMAEELGMQIGTDVIFTGAVPERELAAHYALGNVYCHTGREESFGLSVVEALFTGLPVVAVNEGGPRRTVQHGVSGYLVPATPRALGGAIAGLLSDPSRARMMGTAGQEHVIKEYSWERGVDTLATVLERVSAHMAR